MRPYAFPISLLLLQMAAAITNPRAEEQLDRRRQIQFPSQGSNYNNDQSRFVNSQGGSQLPTQSVPLVPENKLQQSAAFQQQNFLQNQRFVQNQQQPQSQHGATQQTAQQGLFLSNVNQAAPQVNHLQQQQPFQPSQNVPVNFPVSLQASSAPQINSNLHGFQPQGVPLQSQQALINNHRLPGGIPQQQSVPTSNVPLQQPNPASNIFLPTLATQQLMNSFSHILSQQVPTSNISPSQFSENVNQDSNNHAQLAFQSNLGNDPLFSNGQSTQLQSLFEQQSRESIERMKELEERRKIIQKHKLFLERQQQKQQEKVNKLHEEFLNKQSKKQEELLATTVAYEEILKRAQSRPREIFPHESALFQKAIQMYDDKHPTTTTPAPTTASTTTEAPTTRENRIRTRQKSKTRNPPESSRQKLYNEIKTLLEEGDNKAFDEKVQAKSLALLQKPDILRQLKLAIAENPADFNEKNFSTREISLGNGQKFEIIRTTNPNLIPAGAIAADSSSLPQAITPAPQVISSRNKVNFEELTKGVLPPGADFELIKQSENGKLEEVEQIPSTIENKKKLTFVFLEEQQDGSYKVKGVKANGAQSKEEEAPDVDNILQKIKNGEIQLPIPTKSNSEPTTIPTTATPEWPSTYSVPSTLNYRSTSRSRNEAYSTTVPTFVSRHDSRHSPSTSSQYTSNFRPTQTPVSSTARYYIRTTTSERPSSPTTSQHLSQTTRNIPSQTTRNINRIPSSRNLPPNTSPALVNPTVPSFQEPSSTRAPLLVQTPSSTRAPSLVQFTNPEEAGSQLNLVSTTLSPGLVDILKEHGLFATAKYLKQSGLDTILNETGPYTIFAPTDKAFRTLLVQLGGPDKAEEKFKDNPRLLSGLLLHHVIPGAFDIAALQDEMTGVSLAGTQLRVNQYDMHDVEWNEIKVTTINGARVLDEMKDINIPQGIAHAVDRVMFPLPVGDLVQTLQADRDKRFTQFLRAIFASGFATTLSESKTYTVFAPTDAAFARLPAAELTRLGERAPARALVARHIMAGTLYGAGMRYYQQRDSMEPGKPITLQKNSGRIKVNNAQVLTHNTPATNGVIHAVDVLL